MTQEKQVLLVDICARFPYNENIIALSDKQYFRTSEKEEIPD